jgi:myo-inositol catabolism protein IolC
MASSTHASNPMYLLAFDHRGVFQRELIGHDEPPTAAETDVLVDAKELIFEGLIQALDTAARPGMGLLVDDRFGGAIPRLARARELLLAMPAERSDRPVFEFEHGDGFGEAILREDPDITKVLVRLNPEEAGNRVQLHRLRRLSDWLRDHGRMFMFELIVAPTAGQLEQVGGDALRFERELRPTVIREAIVELRDAGIDPHIWKIEGFDDRDDAVAVVAAARAHGREDVRCIVLGSDAAPERVDQWLRVAASVDGFAGFAIGRTIWREPLQAHLAGERSRPAAISEIAERYRRCIDVYEGV